MAYAQQLVQPLASPTPSSHSDSELQRRRTSHSVVILGCQSAAFFSATCRNDASSSPRPASRSCWAKKHITKSKHHDPMAEQALEMSCRPLSPTLESPLASNGLLGEGSSPMNRSRNNKHPENLPVVDIWSPLGGGSSSEENNSPTDLNSCKQIKDKPPLLKNVEVVKEKDRTDDVFKKDHIRPSSGGYINEGSSWDFASTVRVSSFNCGSKHDSRNYSPRKLSKSLLSCNNQSPSAPPTDEENLLESSSERSSKRSSQSSCDQNVSSVFSERTAIEAVSSKIKSHTSSTSINSSVTPPPPPERHDSLSAAVYEEKELRGAPWFQAGIPREIALEVLAQEPVGSFMVRESTSKPGCFALSLRVPREFHQSGIAHYLIMRTNRGYKIKGFTKEFGTLTALITHHSVMPELLPCPLSLSRYNPTFKKHDSEDMMDIDEDPDYLLSDFRKMLADINA